MKRRQIHENGYILEIVKKIFGMMDDCQIIDAEKREAAIERCEKPGDFSIGLTSKGFFIEKPFRFVYIELYEYSLLRNVIHYRALVRFGETRSHRHSFELSNQEKLKGIFEEIVDQLYAL